MKRNFFVAVGFSILAGAMFTACSSEINQSPAPINKVCEGNFDHLKLSPAVAESYIAKYSNYLENIAIDAKKSGTPTLKNPKFQSFVIPECELETIVKEFSHGMEVWVSIGINKEEPNLIFEVKDNSKDEGDTYFDRVKTGFEDVRGNNVGERNIKCDGNYEHYKITEEEAIGYISNYKQYLNLVEISNNGTNKVKISTSKVEKFKLPACELETIVKEYGPGLTAYAVIGINSKDEPTLIFKVGNAEKSEWGYFDFAYPCPDTCD